MKKIILLLSALLWAPHVLAQNQTAKTTLTLTVTGHQATLAWGASTSCVAGVTCSYNVYRSGTTGGPYTKIANVTTLSYVDTLAVTGQKVFYVMTAYIACKSPPQVPCGESLHSNEVSAVIP